MIIFRTLCVEMFVRNDVWSIIQSFFFFFSLECSLFRFLLLRCGVALLSLAFSHWFIGLFKQDKNEINFQRILVGSSSRTSKITCSFSNDKTYEDKRQLLIQPTNEMMIQCVILIYDIILSKESTKLFGAEWIVLMKLHCCRSEWCCRRYQ